MKAIRIISLLLLFFCTIACANNSDEAVNNANEKKIEIATNLTAKDSFEAGRIISPVFCTTDPGQSYAIYIPVKGNSEPLPVVYFFDPHGNGSLPLAKYKTLADLYNLILVGSNNSKNGNDWSMAENIWNNLFNDSQKRLKINANRIYI